MKKLFLSMMLLALPLLVSAYDCKVDGIYYNLNKTSKTAEVTFKDDNYNSYYGYINIPEKFSFDGVDYSVSGIGEYAFYLCENLKSVNIPNSVTNIGDYGFNLCKSLKNVTIPKSVKSIGNSAFGGCISLQYVNITDLAAWCNIEFKDPNSNPTYQAYPNPIYLDGEEIKDLVIPNGVTTIRKYAFNKCDGLASVTIPNSVTTIEGWTFEGCTGLTSVAFGNSVTYIGNSAFFGCTSLKSVFIPNSVITIDTHAFMGCYRLKSLKIGNSVTTIGDNTFNNCKMTTVTIPNSVKKIGDGAFYKCGDLATVISKMEDPCYINPYCFDKNVFSETILYVPLGTKAKYKSRSGWNKFIHIEEGNPFEHTLTYLVDGETYSTYTLEEGDAITPDEAPTKEGYSFSGWSEIPETMPANDVTITGTFVPNKYKLTYLVDGGEYKSSEVEFGSAITAEDNPTKEGYTFSGWSEIPETMPASDVTITGSFTINKYKLTYTLDGEEYKTAEVDYGTALTPEEAPVKEGYTFSGWSEIPETMPANDVTVTGTFTANKYKLTYMVDGEEYKSSEVDYGTAITAEAVPTKEGYTFSGWSEIPSTMPAEDVTVTGSFTVNKYTITYMVDDVVLMTEEVAYGSTIAPPRSQKDGYDILWSSHPTTMPAYDITIYGTYTTGINGLNVEEDERQVFTPDGKRVDTPKKGLNIIRMSDGTVKKVVVK